MLVAVRLKSRLQRLRRYLSVGVLCTALNVTMTIALQFILPLPMAAAISFFASGQVSFVLHTRWTYHDRPSVQVLIRWILFILGNAFFGFGVNRNGLGWFLDKEWFGNGLLQSCLAYLFAFGLSWPGNFAWSHYVVFRHKPVAENDPYTIRVAEKSDA